VRRSAFLSLAFAPGEAAQVDWGCAGTISLGNTRRRLSFFVMVLCHSRMAYVEFTCGEATEHFLACHHNALEFFGGTPGVILIDYVPAHNRSLFPAVICGRPAGTGANWVLWKGLWVT